VYQGQFDFNNFSTQIHDFDPGFGPPVSSAGGNGEGTRVFWTVAIPDSDVTVDGTSGKAEMHVHDLQIRDYFNIPNALGPVETTTFASATVSFDVVWSGPVTRRINVRDGTNGNNFAGEFAENQVTVTWSATNSLGFSFTANPGTLATSVPDAGPIAEIGHERNGDFVTAGDGESAAVVLASAALTSSGGSQIAPPASASAATGASSGFDVHGTGQIVSAGASTNGSATRLVGGAAGLDADSVAALFTELGRLI
jgi:hypothetical protein